MEEKLRAKIDGKEIEVELVQDDPARETRSYNVGGRWRLFVPFAVAALVIIAVLVLSTTLFIWALPILLPLLIVWFIIKLMK